MACLQSSLIQGLFGLLFLVDVFGMVLLAIEIKVLVKKRIGSCVLKEVDSCNKLEHCFKMNSS